MGNENTSCTPSIRLFVLSCTPSIVPPIRLLVLMICDISCRFERPPGDKRFVTEQVQPDSCAHTTINERLGVRNQNHSASASPSLASNNVSTARLQVCLLKNYNTIQLPLTACIYYSVQRKSWCLELFHYAVTFHVWHIVILQIIYSSLK